MSDELIDSGLGEVPVPMLAPSAPTGAKRMNFRVAAKQASKQINTPAQTEQSAHGFFVGSADHAAASPTSFGDSLSTTDSAVLERAAVTPAESFQEHEANEAHDIDSEASTVFSPVFNDANGSPADKKNRLVSPKAAKDMSTFMRNNGFDRSQDGPDIVPASDPQQVPASDTTISGDAPLLPSDHDVVAPMLSASTKLKSPPVPMSPRLRGLFSDFWGTLDSWVDSAAGYDEKILEAFGTPTDEKRRRNIGRAIVVATLVGSLGWLVKISLAMPAPYGIVVGLIISGLYGVLSYSLESFFAANVNPFAPMWSKCLSLFGRSALSALIAFSGALPWVTMSLKGSIHLEMAKLSQTEQIAMHDGIDKIHGLTGLGSRSAALQSELTQWSDAVTHLPAPIEANLTSADQCDTQFTSLSQENPKRVTELTSRLGLLSRLESGAKGDAAKIAAVNSERRVIGKRVSELNKAVGDKKAQCAELRTSANAARDDHIKMATQERQSAQIRLSRQREAEQSALVGAQRDTDQADQVTKLALSENSAGEFTALISLLKTQFFAQFLGSLIFMGLFMVDVLPLTLRLFARPGPYDGEKRADDAIRMMRAEGRRMQAELIHEARRIEITSPEFRNQLQKEVRPHLRSIALNDVGRFVAKQRNPTS